MNRCTLIVITGNPATGKTDLAKRLALTLGAPLFSKDTIKELFFGVFGISDRDFSQRMGAAAVSVLYSVANETLRVGQTTILECNFNPLFARSEILEVARANQVRICELNLWCEVETILERFFTRAASGVRHIGHGDNLEMVSELRAKITANPHARCFPEAELCMEIEGVDVLSLSFDTTVAVSNQLALALDKVIDFVGQI